MDGGPCHSGSGGASMCCGAWPPSSWHPFAQLGCADACRWVRHHPYGHSSTEHLAREQRTAQLLQAMAHRVEQAGVVTRHRHAPPWDPERSRRPPRLGLHALGHRLLICMCTTSLLEVWAVFLCVCLVTASTGLHNIRGGHGAWFVNSVSQTRIHTLGTN